MPSLETPSAHVPGRDKLPGYLGGTPLFYSLWLEVHTGEGAAPDCGWCTGLQTRLQRSVPGNGCSLSNRELPLLPMVGITLNAHRRTCQCYLRSDRKSWRWHVTTQGAKAGLQGHRPSRRHSHLPAKQILEASFVSIQKILSYLAQIPHSIPNHSP